MDQKPVSIATKQEGGRVILKFDRDIGHLEVEPKNMLDLCENLAGLAYEAQGDIKPVNGALKASLVERHRDKLIPRCALLLNGMREDKKLSNGQLAVKLVDIFCHEVFS